MRPRASSSPWANLPYTSSSSFFFLSANRVPLLRPLLQRAGSDVVHLAYLLELKKVETVSSPSELSPSSLPACPAAAACSSSLALSDTDVPGYLASTLARLEVAVSPDCPDHAGKHVKSALH